MAAFTGLAVRTAGMRQVAAGGYPVRGGPPGWGETPGASWVISAFRAGYRFRPLAARPRPSPARRPITAVSRIRLRPLTAPGSGHISQAHSCHLYALEAVTTPNPSMISPGQVRPLRQLAIAPARRELRDWQGHGVHDS